MKITSDFLYLSFSYGYSNYSRPGYAKYQLTYSDLVTFEGERLRSTIGGTGLAISAFTKHKEAALAFSQMVLSPLFQTTLYVEHGGQPGHKAAWISERSNYLTNNFFTRVLPAMENGYIRPRYNGYLHFQDAAGEPIQQYLLQGGNAAEVLQQVNELYQQSLSTQKNTVLS